MSFYYEKLIFYPQQVKANKEKLHEPYTNIYLGILFSEMLLIEDELQPDSKRHKFTQMFA